MIVIPKGLDAETLTPYARLKVVHSVLFYTELKMQMKYIGI